LEFSAKIRLTFPENMTFLGIFCGKILQKTTGKNHDIFIEYKFGQNFGKKFSPKISLD